MKNGFLLCIALAALAVCCSQPSPRPRSETRPRKAGGESRMLFPRIMHEMPESGVLDLGPVIVLKDVKGLEPTTVLQEAAERLGADAFVLENSEVSEAYPVKKQRVGSYLETFDGSSYQFNADLYRGTVGAQGGTSASEKSFYRAIRFVDEDQKACRLDRQRLDLGIAALFEGVDSLKEQLRILSVLAARGVINGETLRAVRKHCLDQVPRKPAASDSGP